MKKIIVIILCLSLVFCLGFNFRPAYATVAEATIGAAAYAIMQSWGLDFYTRAAQPSGIQNWMVNQMQTYSEAQGSSILETFAGQIAVDAAGKMVVAQQIYNTMIDFKDWLLDTFGLGDLFKGTIEGVTVDEDQTTSEEISGVGIEVQFDNYHDADYYFPFNNYRSVRIYNGGTLVNSLSPNSGCAFTGRWRIMIYSYSGKYTVMLEQGKRNGTMAFDYNAYQLPNQTPQNQISWSGDAYVAPTVIDPSQTWEGDIEGGSVPDTTLDELVQSIYDLLSTGAITVEGEVVSPVPEPTPIPTVAPDTPLAEAPYSGLTDIIGSQTGEITGSIEGVQEGVQEGVADITEAIGTQTGEIAESIEGVQEGVADLTDVLEEATTVPTPEAASDFKWDLSTLFPFCIPFDIADMLEAFDGVAAAPHVQIPIVIPSMGFRYNLDLDFSPFDPVAAILRQVELIAFGIALAWGTSKVIRW